MFILDGYNSQFIVWALFIMLVLFWTFPLCFFDFRVERLQLVSVVPQLNTFGQMESPFQKHFHCF